MVPPITAETKASSSARSSRPPTSQPASPPSFVQLRGRKAEERAAGGNIELENPPFPIPPSSSYLASRSRRVKKINWELATSIETRDLPSMERQLRASVKSLVIGW